jgi:hypothetical protein
MQEMQATQVAPLDPCELLPVAFVRIQLQDIRRQTLSVESVAIRRS